MSNSGDAALRLRIQGAVLIVLIFAVGVLAGGAFERVRARHGPPMRRMMQPGELPGPFGKLELTEDQRTRIVEIFDSARPRTDAILQEMMPRLQAIQDSIQADIREVLTPEQVALLDEEVQRDKMRPGGFDGRWRGPFRPDSMSGGPGGPGGPGGGLMPFPPDSPPDFPRGKDRPGG